MIVGGYSLDLYCDHPKHDRNFKLKRGQIDSVDGQFYGQTYADCARQARARGWRLSRDQQQCICPSHSGKKKPKKKLSQEIA